MPAAEPAAAPLTPEEVRRLIDRLNEALNYDLGAVEPLLDALRAGTRGTAAEPVLEAVAADVDVFDIDAALARLREIEPVLATGPT